MTQTDAEKKARRKERKKLRESGVLQMANILGLKTVDQHHYANPGRQYVDNGRRCVCPFCGYGSHTDPEGHPILWVSRVLRPRCCPACKRYMPEMKCQT